jgi:hypothetical protein
MNKFICSLLSGLFFGSVYAGIAWFTVFFKGSGLDTIYISSGVVLAPLGALILNGLEAIGLVAGPGMGAGILIYSISAYILWACIFTLLTWLSIKYVAVKNH